MEYWLATSPWPGVVLWILLYVSDYYLTIYCARGFRELGIFHFEGSFELTPQFQADVDALRPVSRRHLLLLILCSLIIWLLWSVIVGWFYQPGLYNLYLGLFILVEVAVHLRHLRNAFLIREVKRHGGIDGQISYRRWFSYRVSAFELYLVASLFFLVALLAYSWFFLGGTLVCLGTGLKHDHLARKARTAAAESQV